MDVSIIIPTYNRIWSLPRAIDSCFLTALNIEVIVIDDGSIDGSGDWLNLQPNIRVFHQQNLGKDWAINNFFKEAKGKYIRFLDSDDWLLPYSCDQLFEEAELKNADVVAAGHEVYNEHQALIYTDEWTDCDDFIAQQLGECSSSHYSAYLFKRNFIATIPHRQEYGARDDRQFMVEVALKNPITSFITTKTLAHSAHEKNRLQKQKGLDNSMNNLASLKIYRNAFAILESRGELTPRRIKAGLNVLWPLAHWVAIDHVQDGKKIFEWIKLLHPAFKIPNAGMIGLMYRWLGFGTTEKILKLRRMIINGVN